MVLPCRGDGGDRGRWPENSGPVGAGRSTFSQKRRGLNIFEQKVHFIPRGCCTSLFFLLFSQAEILKLFFGFAIKKFLVSTYFERG